MPLFTSTELVAMGRHIPTPFSIEIEFDGNVAELKVESILRTVPGKRLVALCKWQEREVIAKIFMNGSRFKRTMLKDVSGIDRLRRARIPTPNLLLQTVSGDQQAGVLILEYLRQGSSLAELYDEAENEEVRAEVLGMGVKAVAVCHQAGLWQDDIHLDNFMLSGEVVYMLDGAGIKETGKPLDARTRLSNFARFLAQFPVEQDEHWPLLVELYKLEAPQLAQEDTAGFAQMLLKARRKRIGVLERKLHRSTSANRCEQGSGFFYVYDRSIHSEELDRFLQDPDSFIDRRQLLKDGNSSTVAKVRIDERDYVLKRYNIKNFWHGVSRAFRPSRAQRSWRNASVLEMLGVATAHPFLYLEERTLWVFRRRAYFLCEILDGKDLGATWKEQKQAIGEEEVVNLFAKLFRVFADYHISHGDMKATNFLIKDGRLNVLDLDAMQRIHSDARFREKFNADLMRFKKNWVGTSMEPKVDRLLKQVEGF